MQDTVLIVEDDWLLAAQLDAWLEEEGLTPIGSAASVEEALKLADGERPTFALVDVNLNGVLAWPLMDELRRRGVMVIVTTGYSHVAEGESVCAVLEKPYGKDDVMRALRHAGLKG